MQTENLRELRILREAEKALKERIDEVSDAATSEALAILASSNKDRGEFTADGEKYQLQRTEVYDMSNYNRYKGAECLRWRELKAQQDFAKKTAAADTMEMNAITKVFAANHPDWEPDEVRLTLKIC